jgi:hypothetical protein
MSTNDTSAQDTERRQRELIRASAQRKEELMRELSATQERERARQREAEAAKTARLRALRLAREAADAVPDAQVLRGARALPRQKE